jgi:hypothetical protein
MMKIITPKKIIVFVLIALVLVLALPVQSTQASMPGQTVPTAKPRNKSSNSSSSGESTTATPEVLQNKNLSTQSIDTATATVEVAGGQVLGTLAPGGPANLNVAVTPAAQGNITAPDSNLIPFKFSSDPVPLLYQYLGLSIIGSALILIVSYLLFKRNRKEKPTG